MFTWKKKAPVVDEKVEESTEENKEEVTSEPATDKNEDEAKEVESEETEEKSAEVEKESLNNLVLYPGPGFLDYFQFLVKIPFFIEKLISNFFKE